MYNVKWVEIDLECNQHKCHKLCDLDFRQNQCASNSGFRFGFRFISTTEDVAVLKSWLKMQNLLKIKWAPQIRLQKSSGALRCHLHSLISEGTRSFQSLTQLHDCISTTCWSFDGELSISDKVVSSSEGGVTCVSVGWISCACGGTAGGVGLIRFLLQFVAPLEGLRIGGARALPKTIVLEGIGISSELFEERLSSKVNLSNLLLQKKSFSVAILSFSCFRSIVSFASTTWISVDYFVLESFSRI